MKQFQDFSKFIISQGYCSGLTCTSLVLCLNLQLSRKSRHVYKMAKWRGLEQGRQGTVKTVETSELVALQWIQLSGCIAMVAIVHLFVL